MIRFYKCQNCNLCFSKIILGGAGPVYCPYCNSHNFVRIGKKQRQGDKGQDMLLIPGHNFIKRNGSGDESVK